MEPSRTVIDNALVVTMDPRRTVYDRGHVIVQNDRIARVGAGPAAALEGRDVVIDAAGCVVLPGFVNTHHHLASTLLRGLVPGRPLQVKVDAAALAMHLHGAQGEAECHAGALLAAAELTRSGVTTTTDSQAPWQGMRKNDGSLRAAAESGLRVVHSPAFVNRTAMVPREHQFSVAGSVAEFERLAGRWSSASVTVIPEVMSLPRGTDELISALYWAGGRRLAMHLSYSPEMASWATREYGHPAIEHLDRLGVLGEGFLGAHPIYLSDHEVGLYGRAGAAAAYCAVSNMLIGTAHLKLSRLQDRGIRVGLGLDYPNHAHNFFETMKISLLAQKQLTGDATAGDEGEALAWATIDGARALGLGERIGSLEPGKLADLQVIDLRRPELSPPGGALALLVYAAAPEVIRDVMASGRWLMRDRRLVHLDERSVLEESAVMQERIASRAGLAPELLVPQGWRIIG